MRYGKWTRQNCSSPPISRNISCKAMIFQKIMLLLYLYVYYFHIRAPLFNLVTEVSGRHVRKLRNALNLHTYILINMKISR